MENLREGLKDRKCKSETDMRSERERTREREGGKLESDFSVTRCRKQK